MYEDCCFDLFEGFIEYLIELDDNNLIKMIINYYRDSPNKFLERICEHIVASGNEELYNYVIDIIPKVDLDNILTHLIDSIIMGNDQHEHRVQTIINMGADINNIHLVDTAIIGHIVYLRQLGFTDHFYNDRYINHLTEVNNGKLLISYIHGLVEAGLDLNYIEEKLGLK